MRDHGVHFLVPGNIKPFSVLGKNGLQHIVCVAVSVFLFVRHLLVHVCHVAHQPCSHHETPGAPDGGSDIVGMRT